MIRWTTVLSILVALGCGGAACGGPTERVEDTEDVEPPDEAAPDPETAPSPEEGTEGAGSGGPTAETATAGGTEGSGLGADLVGHCRELVGSARPEVYEIDALVENASCAELPELVDCLSTVGSEADRQERARVLDESCP